MNCSTPGFPVLHHLPELAETHVYRVGNAIQPSHPLSSPSSPAFTLSKHLGLFLWVSSSHQVAKVLELQLQNQSSNEYLGLISFQIDWLISLQSKGLSRVFSNTTAQKHQFFNIQPSLWSNSHIHTRLLEKSLTLTLWTFVNKIMSLLFNMLSSFVRTFLSRNKCLLISWLQSPSAVILEPKKIKAVTVSIVSPSICHELMPWSSLFECWVLSQLFHSSISFKSRGSLIPLPFLP